MKWWKLWDYSQKAIRTFQLFTVYLPHIFVRCEVAVVFPVSGQVGILLLYCITYANGPRNTPSNTNSAWWSIWLEFSSQADILVIINIKAICVTTSSTRQVSTILNFRTLKNSILFSRTFLRIEWNILKIYFLGFYWQSYVWK